MPSRKAPAGRGYISLLSFAVMAVLSGPVASVARAGDAHLSPWAGPSTPTFTLDDLQKQRISLADLRSDIVIVHFFATWCEPCRDELPALRRLVERSDPARLRVISVSVAEVDVRVRNFAEKTPVNFPILLDRDRAVAKSWNVNALPTTVILDRDLKPRLFIERDYDWDKFDGLHALKAFGD